MRLLILSIFTLSVNSALASDPLNGAIESASSAMRAQSERMKIIAQNIANEDSTALTPGGEPYRRKTIIFKARKDPRTNTYKIVTKEGKDKKKPFRKIYAPNHPAADAQGYVLYSNVSKTIESADAKEAARSYEGNLSVIEITRSIMNKTVDILR
jgi:flagellar basal-body rod protein FlgC